MRVEAEVLIEADEATEVVEDQAMDRIRAQDQIRYQGHLYLIRLILHPIEIEMGEEDEELEAWVD